MDQKSYERRWATLSVLCVALLIIGLDTTVLNVALPMLQRELSATASHLQWIVDGYAVVFAGLLLTAGAWGDRYGRRRGLIIGLLIFGAASMMAALCDGPAQLITARAVMGVGGALIMPSTLSILTNSFRDARERKTAIGIWAGVSGLGAAAGPAIGGLLLQHFDWPAIFYLNLPVVAAGVIGALLVVPESRAPATAPLDPAGCILSVIGLVSLVWAIIEAPNKGWTAPPILIGFAVAATLLTAFAVWELRAAHPMLDVRLFRDRRFSIPSVSIMLTFFVLFGTAFFLSQYMQVILGYDPLGTGIRILPLGAGLLLGAPMAMAMAQRIGEKIPTALGMVMLSASFLIIFGVTAESGYGRILGAILMMGFGMSFAMAPATEAVMGALPLERAGVGSAVNDTVRQIGGALGVAVLGSVLNSVYRDRIADDLTELPPEVAGVAQDNVQSAMEVAAAIPDPGGQALVGGAFDAFLDGLNVTVLLAAGICLLAVVVVSFLLPHHAVPSNLDTQEHDTTRRRLDEQTHSRAGSAGASSRRSAS